MNTQQHDSDPFSNQLRDSIASTPLPPADANLREALLKRLNQPAVQPALSAEAASRRRTFFQRAGIALVSTAALVLVGVLWQRPDLQVIGWNDAEPANARAAAESASRAKPSKNDQSAANSTNPPSDTVDDLLLTESTASHDRRVREAEVLDHTKNYLEKTRVSDRYGDVSGGGKLSEEPRITTGTSPSPFGNHSAGQGQGGVGRPQNEIDSKEYDAIVAGSRSRPARPAAGGGPQSGPVAGDELASASKSPDVNSPAPPKSTTPETRSYSAPQGEPTVTSSPRMSVTPRIIVQEETKEGLGIEFKNKPQNGQGLPAGLTPGEQPNHFYKETAEGKPVVGKEVKRVEELAREDSLKGGNVKGLEAKSLSDLAAERETFTRDRATVLAEKDKLAEQLVAKDALLRKEREVELREKYSKVVALTEEINRSKAKGEAVPEQQQQKKLAQLSAAIKEAQQLDDKFRFIQQPGGEQYAPIVENEFRSPSVYETARSTFAIDVDTASYANVRRFLNNGQLPPPDAVRIEELVNYFKYQYPQPKGDDPFSVSTEMADCPWHPGHKLLRVGLQGKEIHRAERPASNLVFLVDTSGSMTDENKLPLLRRAFTRLVGELNDNDKVTIVTYAGNAGLRLPPTRGHEKETIIAAIEGMQSGGSTHGSAGIKLAYEVAAAQFIKDGTNKVILATDGDLNVGITDDAALVELITEKAKTGVYLTVLGVGTGNLKDAKMERLADNGNGIYAYLDSDREAQKVLVEEMSGSLVTIAKDVKIQVEFNPTQVQSYRLLGYENRVMANKEFRNDQKDAGEIGAGHSVTALYEVALVGSGDTALKGESPVAEGAPMEEPLKYQRVRVPEKPVLEATEAGKTGEILTVRLRYKKPDAKPEDAAKELEFPLKDKGGNFNSASQDFQFASAVVAFGLTLRNSEYRGGANLSAVAEIAAAGVGKDPNGHRAEFLELVRRTKTLRGE